MSWVMLNLSGAVDLLLAAIFPFFFLQVAAFRRGSEDDFFEFVSCFFLFLVGRCVGFDQFWRPLSGSFNQITGITNPEQNT